MASDDGWIEWAGGKRPVAEDVEVEVKFRQGTTFAGIQAKRWMWQHKDREDAFDIIAYRITQP